MLSANLVFLAMMCQAPAAGASQETSVLVEQLGSARYAEREAAASALERIGRSALAALRAAHESRDPEVRTRAAALAQRIENALLTQPTRLQLDFQNTPLPDVARSLSLQTGFRVELYPSSNLPKWRQQRVSLHESGAVDFWRAIDQLCDLAGLQYNANMHGYVGHTEPIFPLTDGTSRVLTPNSDHGPFRISLTSVDYQKHVTYAPSGAGARVPPPPRPAVLEPARGEALPPPRLNPITNVQFSAQLSVAAEPRLALSQVRPLELVEAIDERGNSLLPVTDEDSARSRNSGYFGVSTSPVVHLQAPLHRPEAAGEWIKKLRGFVTLTVAARRPHPVVIPLLNSVGKTFENQEHRLTVHDIRPAPTNHNVLLEISIRANDTATSSDQPEQDVFNDGFQRADPQHLQIEVVDAGGHLIPWFQSKAETESSRYTLTLTNQAHPLNLKELRYYALTRATVKIPFEFTDIPMP
jgi:hypothetical protein